MKKLLIIRFSALGDIAMTVPVVHNLALQYPDLDITMLSREMARPLFELLPNNVHFFAADLKGRHKGFWGLNRLIREVLYEDFDRVADFHNVLRSMLLRLNCRMLGWQIAVIDKGRKGKRALTRQKNKVFEQQATSFERYAKVLELLRAAELGRTDDTPEVAKNRTAQYFKLTHPLIEYYQKQGKLIEINGMQTIDEVFADICKALNN